MTDDEISQLASSGYCSVAQAAKYLGICKTLVYAEMEAGRLQFIKYKRRRLIPRQAVKKLAALMFREALAESESASNLICGAGPQLNGRQ
jgi:excisionase family DNA binding protein